MNSRRNTEVFSLVIAVVFLSSCLSSLPAAKTFPDIGALDADLKTIVSTWTRSGEGCLGMVQVRDGSVRHLHLLQYDDPAGPGSGPPFVRMVVDVDTGEIFMCAWEAGGELVMYEKPGGAWKRRDPGEAAPGNDKTKTKGSAI